VPDDKPALKDEGTSGSTKSSRRRLRPPAQKILSDPEREDEDLTVAKFYMSRGNLQGAYLRARDAVKVQPDDPDGHILLADVAEKMGKKDEAVGEYEAYLKLDPEGEHVKAARGALAKLK
jgi:Tfp pilus assembly protein PilF